MWICQLRVGLPNCHMLSAWPAWTLWMQGNIGKTIRWAVPAPNTLQMQWSPKEVILSSDTTMRMPLCCGYRENAVNIYIYIHVYVYIYIVELRSVNIYIYLYIHEGTAPTCISFPFKLPTWQHVGRNHAFLFFIACWRTGRAPRRPSIHRGVRTALQCVCGQELAEPAFQQGHQAKPQRPGCWGRICN